MVYAYVYDLASSPIASIGGLGRSGNGLKPHQDINNFSLKSTSFRTSNLQASTSTGGLGMSENSLKPSKDIIMLPRKVQ